VRVIVSGSRQRKSKDFREDFYILDYLHSMLDIQTVIHGGASGIDHMAGLWGAMWLREVIEVKANWIAYGRSAGYRRNVRMAEMRPDLVILFPGGPGTKMMSDIAKRRGIRRIFTKKVIVPHTFVPPANTEKIDDD
jgi:YspA, cpYpsA-related SLOG family